MSNEKPLGPASALMALLFPPLRQRVLGTLLLEPAQDFHLRELARRLECHAGTLGRELDKLARTGLLTRAQQGNQLRYRAATEHPLFPELAGLFRKTQGLLPALREALAPLDGELQFVWVHGSVARGTATLHSDIDLLVLGHTDFVRLARALFPLHDALGREVNPALYTPEDWTRRWREGDGFARELMRTPKLWVKGDDHDLAELVGHPASAGASG